MSLALNPRGPQEASRQAGLAGRSQLSSLARAGQALMDRSPYPTQKQHDNKGPQQAGKAGQPQLARGLTRLRYRVVSASSEDPSSPASSIQVDYQNVIQNQRTSTGEGWCSQKFCSYPQELVLQFETPIRLKTLQILSHEFRISSRVELFYIPCNPRQTESADDAKNEQVCRIGTFSFDDADRYSGAPSREMKTVHLTDIYTQFIKLDMYQPYDNLQNIFQQVSLISVSCVGQQLEAFQDTAAQDKYAPIFSQDEPDQGRLPIFMEHLQEEPSAVASAHQKYGKPNQIGQLVSDEELNSFEPGIRLKINELLDAKAAATSNDDFDAVVSLRDAILFLKEKGQDVKNYQEMKKRAIENEDYEVAKRLKLLIEAENMQIGQGYGFDSKSGKRYEKSGKYKDIVVDVPQGSAAPRLEHSLDQLVNEVNQNQTPFPASRIPRNLMSQEYQQQAYKRSEQGADDEIQFEQNQDSAPLYAQKRGSALDIARSQAGSQLSGPVRESKRFYSNQIGQRYEDQVVPARREGAMDLEEQIRKYEEEVTNKKQANPVPMLPSVADQQDLRTLPADGLDDLRINENEADLSKEIQNAGPAQRMIDVFGQELYMYLQSPVWQERDQALQQIISAIEELVKRDQAQLALNQVVFLLSFQEKNQQVQLKYLQLYLHLAQQSALFKFDNVVKVIAYVLDKLVDQRFEKQADSTYRAFLTRNQNEEFQAVLALLVQKQGYFNVQALKSHNHLQRRLRQLHQTTGELKSILNEQELAAIDRYYPFDAVLRKLSETLGHQNGSIRQVSQDILVSIYDQFGFERIQSIISMTDPQALQPLRRRIPEMEQLVQRSDHKGPGQTSNYGSDQKPQRHNQEGNTALQTPSPNKRQRAQSQHPPCQFCGTREEAFHDSEKLDLHYVISCLMLTNCNACGQIIEVSALNAHLLKECVKKEDQKQCKRCKESINPEIYDEHTQALACAPWKPVSQANRCPLCHKDIGAGEKGWRQHLMTKKCTGNERNTPYEPPQEADGTISQLHDNEKNQEQLQNIAQLQQAAAQAKVGGIGQLSKTNQKAKKQVKIEAIMEEADENEIQNDDTKAERVAVEDETPDKQDKQLAPKSGGGSKENLQEAEQAETPVQQEQPGQEGADDEAAAAAALRSTEQVKQDLKILDGLDEELKQNQKTLEQEKEQTELEAIRQRNKEAQKESDYQLPFD